MVFDCVVSTWDALQTLILDERMGFKKITRETTRYVFAIVDVSGSMVEPIPELGGRLLVEYVVTTTFYTFNKLATIYPELVAVIVLYSSQCPPDESQPLGKCMHIGNLKMCIGAGKQCGDVYVLGREILPEAAWRLIITKGIIRFSTGGTVPEPAFRAVEQAAKVAGIPRYDYGFMVTDGYIVASTFVLPRMLRSPSDFVIYTMVTSEILKSKFVWRGTDVSQIVHSHVRQIPISRKAEEVLKKMTSPSP